MVLPPDPESLFQQTPLYMAIDKGDHESVKLLVDHGEELMNCQYITN